MKKIADLNYDNVPGVKDSFKIFAKSLLRKFYLSPKAKFDDFARKREISKISRKTEIRNIGKDAIPGVFLVASYTDKDRDFLPGMIESASGAFEKVVLFYDDNKKHDFSYNESVRFQALVLAAKNAGAKWVLIGSPKTRFSKEFRKQIEGYFSKYENTPTILGLKERYLWEDFDHYAFPSNVIGDHYILKFFAITDDMEFDNSPIHASQHPINYKNIIKTPASRFYLGRFNISIMKKKAEFYHEKDGKDYSYLYDMGPVREHGETVLGIGDYERKELIGE